MIKYISNNESNGKSKNEIIRPDALWKIDFIKKKKKKKGKTSILVFCKIERLRYLVRGKIEPFFYICAAAKGLIFKIS